jgi:hypothetical protein
LAGLPFDRWRRNAVWLQLVLAAQDLTAWLQALLLEGDLAIAEPKRLRARLLHTAGHLVTHTGHDTLQLAGSWPWTPDLAAAFLRLRTHLPAQDYPRDVRGVPWLPWRRTETSLDAMTSQGPSRRQHEALLKE